MLSVNKKGAYERRLDKHMKPAAAQAALYSSLRLSDLVLLDLPKLALNRLHLVLEAQLQLF
jgi:hypothetical protein